MNHDPPKRTGTNNSTNTTIGTITSAFTSLWRSNPPIIQNNNTSNQSSSQDSTPTTSSNDPSPSSNWSSSLLGSSSPNSNSKRRSRGSIPFEISSPTDLKIGPSGASLSKAASNKGKPKQRPILLGEGALSEGQSERNGGIEDGENQDGEPDTQRLSKKEEEALTLSLNEELDRDEINSELTNRQTNQRKNSLSNDAYSTLSRLQSRNSRSNLRNQLQSGNDHYQTFNSNINTNSRGNQNSIRGLSSLWNPNFTDNSNTQSNDDENQSGFQNASTNTSRNRDWQELLEKLERLDEYVRKIVFQAGVDYQTRPMVVLAACNLPDPKEVNYDDLLDRIMSTLDLFVENDYTVIFFASGGKSRPGWNWIWKAYRKLGRKFRKNLKQLYIVHPTFFTRSLVQFISAGAYFISPKFSKKIVQVKSLSELASFVPLTSIDIPFEVLQINEKVEKKVTLPSGEKEKNQQEKGFVFGVPLEELMGERGEKGGIPRVVKDCVEVLKSFPDHLKSETESTSSPESNSLQTQLPPSLLDTEGLFRRSPSSALLKTIQESYDRGHPVDLNQYKDPHLPAVLLKVFLRNLPEPIFPVSLYSIIKNCPNPYAKASSNDSNNEAISQESIQYIRSILLPSINPPCALILLSYILELLHLVSIRSFNNKMDASNLSVVFCPNLVFSGNTKKDLDICKVAGLGSMGGDISGRETISTSEISNTSLGTIIKFCIERYYEIFDEIDFEPPVSNVISGLEDEEKEIDLETQDPSSPSISNNDNSNSTDGGNTLPTSLSTNGNTTAGSLSPEKVGMTSQSSMSALGLGTPGSLSKRNDLTITPSGKMNATEWTSTLPRRGGHRRLGSTGSSGGISAPTSPRMVSSGLPSIEANDLSEGQRSPSVTKNYKTSLSKSKKTGGAGTSLSESGNGIGGGGSTSNRILSSTIRNSSGSLRLTKGKSGSMASSSPSISNLFNQGSSSSIPNSPNQLSSSRSNSMSLLSNPNSDSHSNDADFLNSAYSTASGLTSTSSGVTLTGANASATFASPSRSSMDEDLNSNSIPNSPSASKLVARKRSFSNSKAVVANRRNKGLSEVFEE